MRSLVYFLNGSLELALSTRLPHCQRAAGTLSTGDPATSRSYYSIFKSGMRSLVYFLNGSLELTLSTRLPHCQRAAGTLSTGDPATSRSYYSIFKYSMWIAAALTRLAMTDGRFGNLPDINFYSNICPAYFIKFSKPYTAESA